MRDSLARMMPIRHDSRRSVLLYGFLGILCFVRTIESAPLTESSESSRLGSTGMLAPGLQLKKDQKDEVGLSSEHTYQAWLLMDSPDSQPFDSGSLRRIKPKSIFIAPNLTACPEGYEDDTMNRCVKVVNIDHQAHNDFLVQRLQALFRPKSHAAASSSVASGPLQLNIPLIISAPIKPAQENVDSQPDDSKEPTSTTDPSKIVSEDPFTSDKLDNRHQDAIVTVYELNDDESTFFLGNKSTDNSRENNESTTTRPDLLVPVAEFVNDANANLFDVVDYKIPASVKKAHNLTKLVDGLIREDHEGTPTTVKEDDRDRNISPTLVLLLSPTKGPSIPVASSDLIVAHNSSLGQVIIKMENVTGNETKEIIRVSVPGDIDSSSSSNIHPDSEEDSTTDSKIGGDFAYGDEDSTEAYYDENNEDSTESDDEILKHSEAGVTVTLSTPGEQVTVNSATLHGDKEPAGSSEISSEVSINDDFVRETTLVDLNVSKTPNSTSSSLTDDSKIFDEAAKDVKPDVGTSSGDLKNEKLDGRVSIAEDTRFHAKKLTPDDISIRNEAPQRKMPIVVFPATSIEEELEKAIQKEATSTERADSAETMIASSTNDAGAVVSREEPKFDLQYFSSNKKRAGQPFRFEATTKIPQRPLSAAPNVDGVYDYDQRDYPRRNPYRAPQETYGAPVMDDQRYRPDTEGDDKNFFGPQQQQQQEYLRFPSYDKHGQPNYVRFPSEEANSIHPNEFKERRPYNHHQQQQNYDRGSSDTKNPSGQDIHQKQSYWWLPPGWQMDKQQQEIQQRSRSGADRSRTPMLLRFWTRMPLVRDPSLNYQHPTYPTPEARNSGSARRVNYYKEMSTQDLNRAFARKSPPSAIGG